MASDPKQTPVPVAELEYEHSPLEDAVIRYRKQLILVGTLTLLGTVGYFGSKLWKDSQHKNAALAFTRAGTVGELRNVATTHSGLPAEVWPATIAALLEQGAVHQEGQKRGSRYRLAPPETDGSLV